MSNKLITKVNIGNFMIDGHDVFFLLVTRLIRD